ncbi:hypothetical protein [Niastella populi]|uniref:DUF2383 domain-containing protein n=1 Tax=Niastella populi TaxID=550983 RepID=A0A1V9GCU8_9BACT|nr:hypothetical protein [Niastella populi]OQP68505.1 hypothetical protein A4R26_01490 [Niastella populi]
MEHQQIAEILNDLSTINRERAKAYEEASFLNFIFNLELRGSFALLANQSRQNSFALRHYLEQWQDNHPGFKRTLPQLTFGDLYNQWKEMGVSFSGPNVYDMLKSCEQGEEAIQVIYTKVINMLPAGDLQYLLENQLRGLQTSHSIVKGIMNQPHKMPQKMKRSI